ncbi:MAG: zf-HC2 domain-containing protein [Acidobacteria bacterium]|nr:zf-HC2 domain-containing protein [Acidobacteriota bacterium]MCZ6649609.1 zf-HC2 domain-containing protein [Acidobacteriota bacterium]MCZ6832190.1 zf-HC2 domain-containing protein [Acidobacteriota bacterium]
MNCREYVEFLMAYVNDELPPDQADAFRQHISDCPPCINYLETYHDTLELEKRAYEEQEALFEEAPENLVKAILAARGEDKA